MEKIIAQSLENGMTYQTYRALVGANYFQKIKQQVLPKALKS